MRTQEEYALLTHAEHINNSSAWIIFCMYLCVQMNRRFGISLSISGSFECMNSYMPKINLYNHSILCNEIMHGNWLADKLKWSSLRDVYQYKYGIFPLNQQILTHIVLKYYA